MVKVFHVVGNPGSGRSTLILAIASFYRAMGMVCVGVDPEILEDRADALKRHPQADVIFLEHYAIGNFEAEPDDTVIELRRAGQSSLCQSSSVVRWVKEQLDDPSSRLSVSIKALNSAEQDA